MCASRLRQRPTARRLHHAWWFRRSRPASCATSATGGGSPLPRPEDHSNRQVTRTSRRTRAPASREPARRGRSPWRAPPPRAVTQTPASAQPGRAGQPSGARPAGPRRGRPGRGRRRSPGRSALSDGMRTSSEVERGTRFLPGKTTEFALVNSPATPTRPECTRASLGRRIPAGPCPQIVASTTSRDRALAENTDGASACSWRARRRARALSASSTGKDHP
jgi:hypothetical protein